MKRTIVMALLAVMVLAAFAEQSFISWWTGTGTDTLYTSHDDLVVGEDTLTADDHDTTAQGSQWPGWVVEEFPFNKWGLETYVDSIGGWPVPDTVFTELRWNYYSGGTYTSWVKYDTIVTLGASTAPVRSLVRCRSIHSW